MNPMLNIAIRAAYAAGDIIARYSKDLEKLQVEVKSHNDFVSQVDKEAENIIIQSIRKSYPKHHILAEESGEVIGSEEYQWIIDPLDGTTNFLHGFPQYSVSIGIKKGEILEHAVVYDPSREELFSASRGQGAQLNKRRIRVSPARGLKGSLLGTGFPFREVDYVDTYIAMFKDFMLKTAGIRRPGSAALDLAYVAAGRLDGFWEINLKPWDVAAGALLVREAGGLVGSFIGEDTFLHSGNIIAATPKVFHEMLQVVKPHLTDQLKT